MKISRQTSGWAYNFLAQGFWGASGVVISLISKALPGTLLVGIRHGIGGLVLGTAVLRSKRRPFKNAPIVHLIGLGIFAGALPDLLVVVAVRHCGPIIAVLLARLEIPLGVLLAHVLLKEKVTIKAYIASGLALFGGCLVSYKPGQALTLHSSFYIGVLAGLGAGVVWALSTVYGKFVLNQGADALAVTFVRLGLGSITSFIAAGLLVTQPLRILAHLPFHSWLWLLYLGVFSSGLGYLLFYRSMAIIDAHVAQILIGTTIAVTLILGLLIGQHVSSLQWLGIVIVVFSIYLISNRSKSQTLPPDD